MSKRASRKAAVAAATLLWLVPAGTASAVATDLEVRDDVVLCTWGGTPADPTGTVSIRPGLRFTPAANDVGFVATGFAECTDGYTGRVTFDGIIQAGSTCATQIFEGKVKGLPGVASFYGPGAGGMVHEFLYDKDGNIVGADQPQVLSGVGQGSEVSDCNTEEGFTDAKFSSTIELWG